MRAQASVECPIEQAQARVEQFFRARQGADGTTHFAMRVPFEAIPQMKGLALDHEVLVEAHTGRDEQNLNPVVRLAWRPFGDVPLPSFDGTLTTWAEGDPNRTFLELDGKYFAPLGTAGELFDETIGHAIAERTANDLINQIALAIGDRPAAANGRMKS